MVPPAPTKDFFISRRGGAMERVAKEVADVLKDAGYTTLIQDYDSKSSNDFVEFIDNALITARDLIVIHSADYRATFHTRREFTNFYAQVAKSAGDRRIIVLRCDDAEPDGLMSAIVYGDLHATTDPAERKRIILAAIRGESTGQRPARAESNISIRIPEHFLGRDEDLAALHTTLHRAAGRVAITALHGMRGVGKTVLAAAYAREHAADYRATWWISAQTENQMRADLTALGIRLGWTPEDAPQDTALADTLRRLAQSGEHILLIYDNAIDARTLTAYLPRGGAAHIIITSNDPAWRGLAEPLAIRLWPPSIGANFLIARTGRTTERSAAESLSTTLGGLPLAHEMAAAYCEQIGIPLADYATRFTATPDKLLDDDKRAPIEYHGGLTTTKAFTLAIEQAAKRQQAAEPLLTYAALLAPEPIPVFLFREGREHLGDPLATHLAEDGLDEAIAALRAFALIDREPVPDERDPTHTTDSIRLHRLIRMVAAARPSEPERTRIHAALIETASAVYPDGVYNIPATWPRARALDGIALALLADPAPPPGTEAATSRLLDGLATYRQVCLAAYAPARPLFERALVLREQALGPDHPDTAASLHNLALLFYDQSELNVARPLFERALAIREEALGPNHPATATSLNDFALLLHEQGDLDVARPLYERALALGEKTLGPCHPDTAIRLSNLAGLLEDQGDRAAARPLFERALTITEQTLGPDHPQTATSLNNLARLLQAQGDCAGARPLFERAFAIFETALGPDHPHTAHVRRNLASL